MPRTQLKDVATSAMRLAGRGTIYSSKQSEPNGALRSFTIADAQSISSAAYLQGFRRDIGLGPNDELVASRTFPIDVAHKRALAVHYRHLYRGVPVIASELVLLTEDDRVLLGNASLVLGLSLDARPQIPLEVAQQTALLEFGQTNPSVSNLNTDAAVTPPQVLSAQLSVVPPLGGSRDPKTYRLAWRFIVDDPRSLASRTIDVDAVTGGVTRSFDNDRSVMQNVKLEGASYYNGTVGFTAEGEGGVPPYTLGTQYQAASGTSLGSQTNFVPVIDVKCQVETVSDLLQPTSQGPMPPAGLSVFSEASPLLPSLCDSKASIQTLWSAEQVFDYWDRVFAYNGINNLAQGTWVNPQTGDNVLLFNDYTAPTPQSHFNYYTSTIQLSDVPEIGSGTPNPWDTVDVVGHEMGHGMYDAVGSAPSDPCTEAAAAEEGIADILGIAARAGYPKITSPSGGPLDIDWVMGSQVTPGGLRSLKSPKPNFADAYLGSNWLTPTCGFIPYTDSTVLGYWFYLTVMGGKGSVDDKGLTPYDVAPLDSNPQTSIIDAVKLIQSALMLTPAPADFHGLMNETTELAFTTLTAQQQQTVANAWAAVGLASTSPQGHLPATGATNIGPWPVDFQWESASPAATSWEIQIAHSTTELLAETGPSFIDGKTTQAEGLAGGQIWARWSTNLQGQETFVWRVRSLTSTSPTCIGGQCPSAWSEVWSFQTGGGATLGPNPTDAWSATFQWAAVNGASSYDLKISEIATDPTMQDPRVYVVPADAAPHATIPLRSGVSYVWQVETYGPPDTESDESPLPDFSALSTQATFTTGPNVHTSLASTNVGDAWRYSFKIQAPDGTAHTDYKGSSNQGVSFGGTAKGTSSINGVAPAALTPLAAAQDSSAQLSVTMTPTERPPYLCLTSGCAQVSGPMSVTPAEEGQATTDMLPIDWTPTMATVADDALCYFNQGAALTFAAAPDDKGTTTYDVVITPQGMGSPVAFNHLAANGSKQIVVTKPSCSDTAGYSWAISAYQDGTIQGMVATGSYAVGPATPQLVSPPDKSTVQVGATITFSWTDAYAPYGFDLLLAPVGQNLHSAAATIMANSYTTLPKPQLDWGTTYRWQILALTPTGLPTLARSEVFSFSTPPQPRLATPQVLPGVVPTLTCGQNGDNCNQNSAAVCSWVEVPGGDGFQFQWTDPNGGVHTTSQKYQNASPCYDIGIDFMDFPTALYPLLIRAVDSTGAHLPSNWASAGNCGPCDGI